MCIWTWVGIRETDSNNHGRQRWLLLVHSGFSAESCSSKFNFPKLQHEQQIGIHRAADEHVLEIKTSFQKRQAAILHNYIGPISAAHGQVVEETSAILAQK